MQTNLAPEFRNTPDGDEAEAILRKCVHCGFCTATCPTYQLLGDELDGPRGRIYLMKQVLEGAAVTRSTQIHLDRCLTCRNCETTCPSGVEYGNLVEIGRRIVDARVERPAGEKAARWLLKEGLTSPLFAPAMKAGQVLRPLLPKVLQSKVPAAAGGRAHDWPHRSHEHKVLLLAGCVQPAMMPNINSATARVLDAAGIETLLAPGAGCCGAIRLHLSDPAGAFADMRRNIDAWWPFVEPQGGRDAVEAIVMNASGCGVTVKEYGHALKDDAAYAEKARRIAELTVDISELLPALVPALQERLRPRGGAVAAPAPARSEFPGEAQLPIANAENRTPPGGNAAVWGPSALRSAQQSAAAARPGSSPAAVGTAAAAMATPMRLAFHPPCTLQHGQKLRGGVETHLRALGFEVDVSRTESHLCCGSAGTYSVLQPELAYALRDRKLTTLAELEPEAIVSANIGCIQHLQTGTTTPVRHWIEVVDTALHEAGH
jgi:glycolate oxidase iron-sulfur subunit